MVRNIFFSPYRETANDGKVKVAEIRVCNAGHPFGGTFVSIRIGCTSRIYIVLGGKNRDELENEKNGANKEFGEKD